jgi:hypothetical protein
MKHPPRQIKHFQAGHLFHRQAAHGDNFEKPVLIIRLERIRPTGMEETVEEDVDITKQKLIRGSQYMASAA